MFTTFFPRPSSAALILGLLILVASLAIIWKGFHPGNSSPVIGPLGETNRAFIENRSILDPCFVLCVSDWPRTLMKPVQLGAVPPSDDPLDCMFWSIDGTVLAIRENVGFSSWIYGSAYDFERHEIVRHDSDRIASLLASRGGVGPEHHQYPDEKAGY